MRVNVYNVRVTIAVVAETEDQAIDAVASYLNLGDAASMARGIVGDIDVVSTQEVEV